MSSPTTHDQGLLSALTTFNDPASYVPPEERPRWRDHLRAVWQYPARFAFLVPGGLLLLVGYGLRAAGDPAGLLSYVYHPAPRWWAIALQIVGLSLVVVTNVQFHRAGGTLSPHAGPIRLVTTGPYAVMRDPMLFGVALFLFGSAGVLGSWLLVIYTVLFLIAISIILLTTREPRHLHERFGTQYAEYRHRVPFMWIPYRRFH